MKLSLVGRVVYNNRQLGRAVTPQGVAVSQIAFQQLAMRLIENR